MIRTTNHTLKFTNVNKLNNLSKFIDECSIVATTYLNYLWDNKICFIINDKTECFDIKNNILNIPSMLSNVEVEKYIENFNSILSGRVKKCILTQILGIIKASTEKQRKRLYMYEKQCNEGKFNQLLLNKINVNVPQKPNINNINFEFNSICVDNKITNNHFNSFIQLKSLGKSFSKIKLPIKFHRNNKKYINWTMKNSFLIGKDFINIRWEKEEVIMKNEGITVGIDQGMKTVLTLSDKQVTKTNKDGYDLDKIITIMSRKRKGSKSFKKCQEHRKNYINWSINQLNFDNIKQVNFETIYNISYKNPTCRKLSSWTNTIIRDKLEDRCTLLGVQVQHQSPTYRSQRCSNCSLVRKSSRKGKVYLCPECGLEIDADYNASLNHEVALPDIPWKLRKLNLNRKGFYWKEDGFYDLNGVVLTVPLDPIIN